MGWIIPSGEQKKPETPIMELSDLELLEYAYPHLTDATVKYEIRRRVREHDLTADAIAANEALVLGNEEQQDHAA